MRSLIFKYYLHNFLRELAFFSAVLVPFFTDWGKISLFQMMLLQSWFGLWVFFLEVPTGAIADYLGRKYSIAVGALAATAGALLYGSFPRFELFLLAEFLFAFGMACTSGADEALLYDALIEAKRERDAKKILSRAHAMTMAGITVASISGSFIAARFGLNAPILFSAIPFFFACLVALTLPEPRKHTRKSEQTRYIDVLTKGFTFFYKHAKLRLLVIDAVLVASSGYFVLWLYQSLLKSIHIPILYFGFVHVTLTISQLIILALFVRLEKLFGSAHQYFRFTALLIAASFFIVALYPTLWTILMFTIVGGGFGLTRLEAMSAYLHQFIPSAQRATVISSISMFRRFLLVVLNPIVGLITTRSLPLGLLAVGAIPLLVFIFQPAKKKAFG